MIFAQSISMPNNEQKTILSVVSILLSLCALVFTLYFQFLLGPKLQIAIGQDIFLNAKPRIGVLCGIYNSGARAGTIVRGSLKVDGTEMHLGLTSPQFESWTITSKGNRETAEKMTYSYFRPVVVEPRTSRAVTLWFIRAAGDSFFARGEHTCELSLYDGVRSDPVARKIFRFQLEPQQVANIERYDAAEFPVRILSQE